MRKETDGDTKYGSGSACARMRKMSNGIDVDVDVDVPMLDVLVLERSNLCLPEQG